MRFTLLQHNAELNFSKNILTFFRSRNMSPCTVSSSTNIWVPILCAVILHSTRGHPSCSDPGTGPGLCEAPGTLSWTPWCPPILMMKAEPLRVPLEAGPLGGQEGGAPMTESVPLPCEVTWKRRLPMGKWALTRTRPRGHPDLGL